MERKILYKLENVDILRFIAEVTEINTVSYKTDLKFDIEILKRECGIKDGIRNFLWMSRNYGTYCLPDEKVYVKGSSAYSIWQYYNSDTDGVLAYYIFIKGKKDAKIYADVYELAYEKHKKRVDALARYTPKEINFFSDFSIDKERTANKIGRKPAEFEDYIKRLKKRYIHKSR